MDINNIKQCAMDLSRVSGKSYDDAWMIVVEALSYQDDRTEEAREYWFGNTDSSIN